MAESLRQLLRWVGGQAKRAVVNEEWRRGEIVMCIAVPDTSILAKSSQLIKYSSSSNSQIKALKQNSNATSLKIFVMQYKLVGHFLVGVACYTKRLDFAGLAPSTSA